jgi:hypothetical protein
MFSPSISVRYWPKAFSIASHRRQSYWVCQTFHTIKLYPLREVLNCLTFRPASRCKPSLKIVQLLFWHIDRKRYYISQGRNLPHSPFN